MGKISLITLHRILWRRVAKGEDKFVVFDELWEKHNLYDRYPDYLGPDCFLCVYMKYHGDKTCSTCPGRWELYKREEWEEKVHCTDGLYGMYRSIKGNTEKDIEERRKLALRIARCADKVREVKLKNGGKHG